jgi:sugar phosphate isomerase/epimerase
MTTKIATCRWDAPFDEFCAQAAEVGYQGIECNLDGWEGREAELRALLERHGLTICAASSGGLFQDPETRQAQIAAAIAVAQRHAAFGIRALEMHTGPRPVGGPSDEQLKRYADGLNAVGKACQPLGVKIGVHNHCVQFLETEREIDTLYSYLDPALVGVGFDTAHLELAGCDVAAMMRRYASRFAYGHLKDLRLVSKPAGESHRIMPYEEVLRLVVTSDVLTWLAIEDVAGRRVVLGGGKIGHDLFRGYEGLIRGVRCRDITEYQFAELGQGFLDFGAVIGPLQQAQYDGWLSVELDVCYRTRPESARMSREYMRRAFSV